MKTIHGNPTIPMVRLSINIDRIPAGSIIKGNKGRYLDLICVPNKNGRDLFGNDGVIAVSVPKRARDLGHKGELIGKYQIKEGE